MTALATYYWADHSLIWENSRRKTKEIAHLSPTQAIIFSALVKRLNHVVTTDYLIGEMYLHEVDEPDSADMVLRVLISRIREKIEDSPVMIENRHSAGYMATGYVEINWDGV